MPGFKQLTRYLLGMLFVAAGINHFWHTTFYVDMMPPYLPWHLALVYLSGVAEISLGILLFFRRWQVWAGWGVIALCVAVFPANVHMALHPELFNQFTPIGLWLRLPLQAVAIAWAWWYTRQGPLSGDETR
ncbi:MAG: MauE/DoxX family redox-associated membrane protein [Polaromonas sp.]